MSIEIFPVGAVLFHVGSSSGLNVSGSHLIAQDLCEKRTPPSPCCLDNSIAFPPDWA